MLKIILVLMSILPKLRIGLDELIDVHVLYILLRQLLALALLVIRELSHLRAIEGPWVRRIDLPL